MGLFGRKKKQEENESAGKKADIVKAGKETKSSSMKDLYRDKAKPGKTSQKKVEGKEAKKETKKKAGSSRAYRVLIKPLITEKAAILNTESKYVFSVATNANKIEIANAVEEVYGIKPIAVNIIKVSGKKVRYGRTFGKRKNWKKAIVALPKGKSINIYEGV